ncbi:hypothetical protein [Kitasatospora sp. GAS1066B]|uniref:hypothetical protein n=1 Tax=Kitasatospora sp. GAS1066B TaxID=3156271 RepID=UPI003517CA54
MRFVLGAQSCGFGPISKLTAISRLLSEHQRTFLGTTVAADFARRNADAFDEIIEIPESAEIGDGPLLGGFEQLLGESDYIVSVMGAELVFRAVVAGRPVLMVDSLFGFWKVPEPTRVAELCASAPRDSYESLDAHFAGLSPHERIYAAHLLADASVVQNFPGVPARATEIRRLGVRQMRLSGAIIDEGTLHGVVKGRPSRYDLVINLGGFKNFLLDYDHHNDYLRLFVRWVPDLLADWPQFERVAVCGGAFGAGREHQVEVAGRRAEFQCMPQPEFLQEVSGTRHYMLTPGLTAIHESLQLGQLPMALPEQHYGHIVNLEQLGDTLFNRLGARFSGLIEDYRVPADDFEGTAAIVDQVGTVLASEEGYARFRTGMNERIEQYLAVGPQERQDGVAELRTLLHGPSFGTLVTETFDSLRSDRLIGEPR